MGGHIMNPSDDPELHAFEKETLQRINVRSDRSRRRRRAMSCGKPLPTRAPFLAIHLDLPKDATGPAAHLRVLRRVYVKLNIRAALDLRDAGLRGLRFC
jgi:hypothetical protein